jgi:endoglucanase
MKPLLLLALLAALPASAQETLKQAAEARLFLKTPTDQPPITQITLSNGQVTHATWEKDPAAVPRQKDIRFPIRWWEWQTLKIDFTPTYDGPVQLLLAGMWEAEKPGTIFRQEILWDDLTATGTTLENGGFENRNGPVPDGWFATAYPENSAWPLADASALEGKNVGASWHNRILQQTLQVKAGQPVSLTLHARAATLPGFVAPKIPGQNTPAHREIAKLKRGVNLGNCWEVPPPYSWKVPFTPDDIDRIADEGFDHIRVPVAWQHHMTKSPDGWVIAPDFLAELEPVLKRALDRKLHILIDWHHFYDLDKDPAANRQRFVDGWTAIAGHFKSWPPELYFELLNEPHDQLSTELLNPIQADAITAIRKTNPERIIFLSPGDWGKVEELDKMILPDNDDRLVVTVHCYEPFIFTHQNSSWTDLKDLKNITYPGPPATPAEVPENLQANAGFVDTIRRYNTIAGIDNPSSPQKLIALLDTARRWSDHFGRPVHLGEFGAIHFADTASRLRYVRDVKTAAESRHIPWTLWEWKSGFGYWDPKTNQSVLRSAIFE